MAAEPQHEDRELARIIATARAQGWTDDMTAKALNYSKQRLARRVKVLRKKGFKV